jgi:hypothetical protein
MPLQRHDTFDQLSKALRTELARLSSSTNIGQTLTLESSNSKLNTNLVEFYHLGVEYLLDHTLVDIYRRNQTTRDK